MIEGNGGRLCEEEGPWLIGLRCCLRHARWGGGTAAPAADASVIQPDQDLSSRATVLGYDNLLCKLFPSLDICRKQ